MSGCADGIVGVEWNLKEENVMLSGPWTASNGLGANAARLPPTSSPLPPIVIHVYVVFSSETINCIVVHNITVTIKIKDTDLTATRPPGI